MVRKTDNRWTLDSGLIRPTLVACAALLVALAFGACGGGGASSTGGNGTSSGVELSKSGQIPVKPTAGGELTIARSGEAATLDPLVGIADLGTENTQMQLFDQLVEVLPGKAGYQPGLAQSWDISKDGLTYTFTLRDAQFSNGQPVTVEDVVFSLDKTRDPNVDAPGAVLYKSIKTVEASGPKQVTITLSQPTPALLGYLSFLPASIVPKDVYQQLGAKQFAVHPVGSGAFVVDSLSKGQRIVLKRNPHYWRQGLPYLDKVTMNYAPDDNARVLSLRSGATDIAEAVPYSQLPSLAKDPKLQLLVYNVGIVESGGYFNQSVKPLDEQVVRQALNYATPREAINKAVFDGLGEIANYVLPKVNDWDPTVKPYPYDLAKAKALLAQSSTPDGFTVELSIVGSDQAMKAIAQILQSAWAQIGVKLKIRGVDAATQYALMLKGDYQMSAFPVGTGSSDVPEPDELISTQFVVDGLSTHYHDDQLKALAKRVVTATDPAEHERLFHEFQRMSMQDPFNVPILFSPMRSALLKTVHGFGYTNVGWFRLDQTSVG